MQKITNAIDKLISLSFVGLLTFTPLFFLPVTQDFYDTNKWMFFLVITLLILILWAVRTVTSNALTISLSPPTLGFGGLVLASLISVILASPNKLEAVIAPYGLTFFAAGMLLFMSGQSVLRPEAKKWLKILWYGAVSLLSLIAVYQFFGVGKTMFPKIAFLQSELWTPIGSTLSLLAVFIISLPNLIADLILAGRKKDDVKMALLFSAVIVISAATVMTAIKVIQVSGSTILMPRDGWAITLEVLKDPKRALFGVGSENFLYAFSTGRPFHLNNGPLWNVRFTTNASVLLHLVATLGILGLIGLLFFAKSFMPKLSLTGGNIARGLALLSLITVPPSITLFVLYLVVHLLTEKENPKLVSIALPQNIRPLGGAIAVVVVALVLLAGFVLGKIYASELVFYKSLQALTKNDGTQTYNLQIQAATLAPFITRYHLAYAQTNLAIANAIATNAQSGEAGTPVTLSDTDRQTISSLIEQSVREAKIAVNLSPENVVAWENLAILYQSLINVVAEVDQWAIATYMRAIQLDPSNPSLRLGLGGVFLLRNDAENAIQQFSLAVNLKSDWANAHYNLAYAYKLRKDNLRAAYSLQQTLNNLPQGSTDRPKAEKEFQEVRMLLNPAEIALLEGRQPTQEELENGSSELTRPDENPQPVITPKIELPPEAAPPSTASGTSEGQTQGASQLGLEEANPTLQPLQ